MNHFKGKQFQKDIIIVAVGYYLRYNLSYREAQELLYDRGINVCHTTIQRWIGVRNDTCFMKKAPKRREALRISSTK